MRWLLQNAAEHTSDKISSVTIELASRVQFNKETTSVVFLQLQSAHVNSRLITD